MLSLKVRKIEAAIERLAKAAAKEPVSVTSYGAFDIHPRHLVYWICVKTEAEKARLARDAALMVALRQTLVVAIGAERASRKIPGIAEMPL
jgi:hypothetical protein